ncbi:carnosine synthase 1-like [Mizuhopecten yessoensis]|uniref:Carnosine synthase 1 n=1 Tax=Mizuhopecten yessoensis TaxID=6573 RepID=A0A210Q5G0_MIZYE|nr:carnosine synthase 1-like [Mizuhopecten yessoensis]OWF43955.1 Carnosine synthase 1 [Mizuhopecten yessoensis]
MARHGCVTYPDQVREKLTGKTILIIGSSKGGQRGIWSIFSDAKIKVILVGHGTSNHAAGQVHTFIQYDYFTDHSDIEKHAINIIQLLGDRVKDIDGCFTFTEEVSPITAVVCEKLRVKGFHPDAAIAAWSKQKTSEALRSKTRNSTFNAEKYSPISYRIQRGDDIKECKQIIYPAILKLEQYESSRAVVKVVSEDDCLLQYNQLQKEFRESSFGETFGTSMVLMELLDGLSYEVDVVIYDGELMTAFVTDIGLYLPNSYACTSICTPSNLSAELQDQLMTAAHHCCCKVGLLNGVFNTEFKMTRTGPKLVEINGRVGSFRRCIIYETTHGVNLWEIAAAIACGIKPCFPEVTPRCFAVGAFLFSKFHEKHFLEEGVGLKLKDMVEAKDILLVMQPKRKKLHCEAGECLMPFCHLVALNKTSIKCARQTLTQLFQDLGFNGTDYDIERFTSVWA